MGHCNYTPVSIHHSVPSAFLGQKVPAECRFPVFLLKLTEFKSLLSESYESLASQPVATPDRAAVISKYEHKSFISYIIIPQTPMY